MYNYQGSHIYLFSRTHDSWMFFILSWCFWKVCKVYLLLKCLCPMLIHNSVYPILVLLKWSLLIMPYFFMNWSLSSWAGNLDPLLLWSWCHVSFLYRTLPWAGNGIVCPCHLCHPCFHLVSCLRRRWTCLSLLSVPSLLSSCTLLEQEMDVFPSHLCHPCFHLAPC